MKTVAQSVEQILKTQPFLEDALQRNIINFSALAEELQEVLAGLNGLLMAPQDLNAFAVAFGVR